MLTPDGRYPNLLILYLNDPLDAKRLLFVLSGGHHKSGLSLLHNEEYLQTFEPLLYLPAAQVAALVSPQDPYGIAASCAVLELEYVDRDSNIAYALLYARAHRDYPRRTIRIHFFESEVSYDDLLNEEALQKAYLGYCVVSPVQEHVIGRTVLPPPRGASGGQYATCQSEFTVNLAGCQLRIVGTPFIQQDGQIAACASASLWMSTSMTRKRGKIDTPARSVGEITNLATRHSLPLLGRGTSPGLTDEQVAWALNEMGYEPMIHVVRDAETAARVIYSYIESGIAPLLHIELPSVGGHHAITVVGHCYDPYSVMGPPLAGSEYNASSWCPHFLIHDDQRGMYLKLRIAPPTADSRGRPTLEVDVSEAPAQTYSQSIRDWYNGASIHYVIAPMPPRYTLRPEEAAAKGQALLRYAYSRYSQLLGITEPDPAVFRSYLVLSNEFRRQIDDRRPIMSDEVASWYRGSVYPRYIWVTELCGFHQRAGIPANDLRIVADVAIDPTSSSRSADFVTLHMPHLFFRMPPGDFDLNNAIANPVSYFPSDNDYPPFFSQ